MNIFKYGLNGLNNIFKKRKPLDTIVNGVETLKPKQTPSKLQQYTPEYKDKVFKHKKARLEMKQKSQRINRGVK